MIIKTIILLANKCDLREESTVITLMIVITMMIGIFMIMNLHLCYGVSPNPGTLTM